MKIKFSMNYNVPLTSLPMSGTYLANRLSRPLQEIINSAKALEKNQGFADGTVITIVERDDGEIYIDLIPPDQR
ncbi:hypothetical protein [Mycobacterium avium]|uniref:hypothetical protein n=1 Tax=Mycobacterium avium TaxID=1764 RepID=UPI00111C64A5|nr:hypothetical protein [Mycobacterium avium]